MCSTDVLCLQVREAQGADRGGEAAGGVRGGGAGACVQEAAGRAGGVDAGRGGEDESCCAGAGQPREGQVGSLGSNFQTISYVQ